MNRSSSLNIGLMEGESVKRTILLSKKVFVFSN